MMFARVIKPFAGAAVVAAFLGVVPATAMTLSEAYQLAEQHDPFVASSEAQYDADREDGKQERSTLLPTVGATGDYSYADTHLESPLYGGKLSDTYPTWSAKIAARQPLFRLDWFARRDRARALDARAESSHRDRQLQVLVRVAERYFGVLVAQDQLDQAEAEAKAVRESLEDTRKRYEVELVPGTDLKEAQARDDLAQARLLSAKTALDTAQESLDEITGNGHVTLPILPEDVAFPPLTPADAEQWVEAAREQSPRIALAREAAQVADANWRSARSAAMPTLDLVGSVSDQDTSDFKASSKQVGNKQLDSRIGIELNMPLFAGGANRSRWRQAEASARAAEAELTRVTHETERETRQLYREVSNAYFESDAYKKSYESAQAAEAATKAGYDAGTRTITDVLDAKSRAVQSLRDLNSTRYNLLLRLLRLRQQTGELSVKDFDQIDQLLRAPAAH